MKISNLLKVKESFDLLYNVSNNGCWEWRLSLNEKGYGRMSLGWGNGRMLAHRYSWMVHNKKEISSEVCVLHQCDNAKCVNPAHLTIGTKAQNNREMAERNRSERGEKRYNAKLNDDNVLWAINKYRNGEMSQHEIAKKLGVCAMTINKAVNGKKWKHLHKKQAL